MVEYLININGVHINLRNNRYDSIDLTTQDGDPQNTQPNDALGRPMVMPLEMKLENDAEFWLVPVEPLVSVSGGNVIAKRTVAKGKGRGTIKERWTQDDYRISINGVILNADDESVYPEEAVAKLKSFCESKEVIQVKCDLLKYFDITRMVIESFDFPFTKGENAQVYTINGVSDDITELLAEEDV